VDSSTADMVKTFQNEVEKVRAGRMRKMNEVGGGEVSSAKLYTSTVSTRSSQQQAVSGPARDEREKKIQQLLHHPSSTHRPPAVGFAADTSLIRRRREPGLSTPFRDDSSLQSRRLSSSNPVVEHILKEVDQAIDRIANELKASAHKEIENILARVLN